MKNEVIKFNDVQFTCTINDRNEVFVPIKPLCEALGISHAAQTEVIKNNPLTASTVSLNETVGSDGKVREMLHLPIQYVFGWLFGIDVRKVKPEAADALIAYQMECYRVLYKAFYSTPEKEQALLLAATTKERDIATTQKEIAEAQLMKRQASQAETAAKKRLEEILKRDYTQNAPNLFENQTNELD